MDERVVPTRQHVSIHLGTEPIRVDDFPPPAERPFVCVRLGEGTSLILVDVGQVDVLGIALESARLFLDGHALRAPAPATEPAAD